MTSRQGSAPSAQDRPLEDPVNGALEGAVPVLVLLSADWAGPSRPAPTLLRELARRWGPAMHTLLLEDPDDEVLDRWEVTHLPTWLRFVPESVPEGSGSGRGMRARPNSHGAKDDATRDAVEDRDDERALRETTLRGHAPGGAELVLTGPWVLSHRRTGALPKHVVESELGPGADDSGTPPVP